MPHRLRFDPKRPLVAARDFTFLGVAYKAGDPFGPFDDGSVSDRQRERQYEARAVNFGEEAAEAADTNPVQMTGPRGGRYTITAPWLDEPEVVRGKVNAEDRLAELREAGEPATYGGYTLTEGENGWWAITRDGFTAEGVDSELKVHGEDAAREAVTKLRAGEEVEGQPAEWTATPEQEGGDPQKETEVVDENERKPEDGDKPNEPGTNQPNGAEVINDHKAAEAGKDGEGDDDGASGVVGP